MNVTLLTFYSHHFKYAKHLLVRSAKRLGIKHILFYSQSQFKKTKFSKENYVITNQSRGAGYWLWKPYYIYQTLLNLKDGEILLYCDSGVNLTASVAPLVEIANKVASGVVLFENYQGSFYYPKTEGIPVSEYNLYTELNKMRYWAKRDAFILMGLDEEIYHTCQMVDANLQVYRKCETSLKFVKEWLDFCCNPQIITDVPNKSELPDFDNLIGHIHDQAIISLIAKKYKIELFRCPTQFGNHYKLSEHRVKNEFLMLPYSRSPKENSPYGTIADHHRIKYRSFKYRMLDFLSQEWRNLKANFS